MAEIRLVKLRKEFKGTVAVREMDLEIREGEFLVLVGPSGCGKTTTLRMIAGLEEPTSGEILIDGRTANDLEPGQRNLGMVFQNLALFPHKIVFENIAFGLRVKKVKSEEVRSRVEQVAKTMHITQLLAKLPAQCSGGEAQRVALARTLITNPSAFLLDEPLSNLDAMLRKEMRAEIDALHSRLSKTFIYVTHDQEEAMTLADRIVVMRGGVVEQVGTPLEIYHEPTNQFVASFFGSPAMNLLGGEVQQKAGRPAFLFDGGLVPLEQLGKVPEGPATLGIRPEAVGIEGVVNGYHGRVALVEPLGKETLVYLSYGAERLLVAVASPGLQVEEGMSVEFDFRGGRFYLFDPEGKRLGRGD
ncbi:MAG: ABC transporter ATP-binding protein [Dehalococcoidia bacterium]|nr:ABC transporter ATP-binding protein [Dehalococcoidia bacterium]